MCARGIRAEEQCVSRAIADACGRQICPVNIVRRRLRFVGVTGGGGPAQFRAGLDGECDAVGVTGRRERQYSGGHVHGGDHITLRIDRRGLVRWGGIVDHRRADARA